MKKHIVVLTGAGISKESGIPTFRDSDGLWCNHRIEDVATGDAMRNNTEQVLDFFNKRRAELKDCQPNDAHKYLAKLEEFFDVDIITQNIDDLHERAGSTKVVHLHGELKKAGSMRDARYVKDIGYEPIHMGDKAPDGGQLRPFIVLFGEDVPELNRAIRITTEADIFIVIGTSLVVYPAASLLSFAPKDCKCFLVDPKAKDLPTSHFKITLISDVATKGVKELYDLLVKEYK